MQHTFQIKNGVLSTSFIEVVRTMFAGRDIKVVVEDSENMPEINQSELYAKSLSAIERFKKTRVDPDTDLSALANEVNL